MRIVGGSLKGRRLAPVPAQGVRPTSDRLRESLFNILEHHGWLPVDATPPSVVLDAFCGTGALAMEALSRGVRKAVLLDRHMPTLNTARTNARTLGVFDRCRFIRVDATKPPPDGIAAGLCFLDPPYGKGLAIPALSALSARGWIAPDAITVIEDHFREAVEPPAGFQMMLQRRFGDTGITILQGPVS